jgi:hypothetical protein
VWMQVNAQALQIATLATVVETLLTRDAFGR